MTPVLAHGPVASLRNWSRQPNLIKVEWEIKSCWRSNKITRTRAGLFMTVHLEGTSDSAARDQAAVLTFASRLLLKTKGERQILLLSAANSAFHTTQTGLCPNALERRNPAGLTLQ